MKTAELVTIGDELLKGDILDANSKWICEKLTKLGIRVDSITIVGDDPERISQALSRVLNSGTDYVIVSGGLGATPDDVTIEAIARTIDRKIKLDQKVLGWIKRKLDYLVKLGMIKEGITPEREKIAMIPEDMTPIYNRVGLAPGLVGNVGKGTLVVLPGVPAELKSLFEEISEEYIKAEGVLMHEELRVIALESDLVPYFKKILEKNLGVKVGSYPMATEKGRFLLVRFYLSGKDPGIVKDKLEKVKNDFIKSMRENNFSILE